MRTSINKETESLIKSFEQCKLRAYQGAADKSGTVTIGWGHVITGHEIETHKIELFEPGQTMLQVKITQDVADKLFEADLEVFAKGVDKQIPSNVIIDEDEYGALISLAYNIGLGAFRTSTVLKKVIARQNKEAVNYFKDWISSNGKQVSGLIRRRAAERALFVGDMNTMLAYMNSSTAKTIDQARIYLGLTTRDGDEDGED
jgi:lysozyme